MANYCRAVTKSLRGRDIKKQDLEQRPAGQRERGWGRELREMDIKKQDLEQGTAGQREEGWGRELTEMDIKKQDFEQRKVTERRDTGWGTKQMENRIWNMERGIYYYNMYHESKAVLYSVLM
jgi:hypothetical protein